MTTIRMTMAAAALAALAFGAGAAAPNDSDAKSQYEAERARCMSDTTGQDQAACLKSAGAAYDSLKQGRLQDPNKDFRENALQRCRSLPSADRADCESRVDNDPNTSVSGSVRGGGQVKETVTRTVGPTSTVPASVAPAPAPSVTPVAPATAPSAPR